MAKSDTTKKKREKIAKLREEIREHRREQSVALAERTQESKEVRLDREIERLETELAAMKSHEKYAAKLPVVPEPEMPEENRTNPAPAANDKKDGK